jgi:hypothetical protein
MVKRPQAACRHRSEVTPPLVAVLVGLALVLVAVSPALANGRDVQREVVARVVAVHPEAGTFEVEREFRGKVWRLTLRVDPATMILTCEQAAATLAEVRPGDVVSVYYEAAGREGVANLVVVEPRD